MCVCARVRRGERGEEGKGRKGEGEERGRGGKGKGREAAQVRLTQTPRIFTLHKPTEPADVYVVAGDTVE